MQGVPHGLVSGDVGHAGDQLEGAHPEAPVQAREALLHERLPEGVKRARVHAVVVLDLSAKADVKRAGSEGSDFQDNKK